jgi:hypothetical protein
MRVVTRTTEYWVYQENGTVAPFPIAGPDAGYPRVLAEFRRHPTATPTPPPSAMTPAGAWRR